jgi:hypothetical protein
MTMAKPKHRRKATKPQKPETYDLFGHTLTAEQYAEYGRRMKGGDQLDLYKLEEKRRATVDSIVSEARPSVKAREQFAPLSKRIMSVTALVGSLRLFPFYEHDVRVRELGNAAIKHAADELAAVESELRAWHKAIEHENLTGGAP